MTTRLSYRPALDGLRAIAVSAVIIYHGNATWLPAGWLGVDMFFVLSGFLITSIILAEHGEWGRLDLLSFWAARARRLFPALAFMLAVVLVAASFWTLPSRRSAVGHDVLATMGYIANWHFLTGDEGYFASLAAPSPLRHTWSLAVEEQFYVLFPLMMVGILALAKRRRIIVVVTLAALALFSALWAGHLFVPDVDPTRVYYGTDTRAQELLVGAALGALMSTTTGWRHSLDSVSRRLALPLIAAIAVSFIWMNDFQNFYFQGGMFAFCLAVGLLVIAAWSTERTRAQRALAWEPLRRVGTISYGLYLWHWPIMVFLTAGRVGFGGPALFGMQVVATFALAIVSFRYIETPIRRNGFRSLVPKLPRPSIAVAALTVPIILAGALLLPHVDAAPTSGELSTNLTVTLPTYTGGTMRYSAFLIGNSVPKGLAGYYPAGSYPDLSIGNSTNFGCDPLSAAKLVNGQVQPVAADCLAWQSGWPAAIGDSAPDVVVLFLTHPMLDDHMVGGRLARWGSAAYARYLNDSFDQIAQTAKKAGADGFAIVNLACHRSPDFGNNDEVSARNDDTRVEQLNRIAKTWADVAQVTVIDQYKFLCTGGYHDGINGVALYEDWMHFTHQSAPIFWSWLAPQIRAAASRVR